MKLNIGKRMIASALAAAMMITGCFSVSLTAKADSCGGLEEGDLRTPDADEVIRDPALHWAIRSALNSIKADPPLKLTAEVVGGRQVQNISYSLCAHKEDFEGWTKQYWIESLEGLQYATSATTIELCYSSEGNGTDNRIKSLEPLANLSQLKTLILRQDGLVDISPLKGLVNLEKLDLQGNKEIRDASAVSDMKKLKVLVLADGGVSSIDAVSGLEKLEHLDISNNTVSNLPDLSKLRNVQFFDASRNSLGNEDVVKIAAMRGLRELNLSSNSSITDIRSLARLIYLEKEKLTLPESLNGEKENLFAAIEVNKLFNKFNISKMKASDSENVGKALEAYEALTDEQKTYFDQKRIAAAKDNKARVDDGLEPNYYKEYDEDGERQPVLDRLQILVVDKKGNPIPDMTFVRKGMGVRDYTTDKNGILEIKHAASDAGWEISVSVKDSGYVSLPEKIEYEVEDGKTSVLNGEEVTGFEDLKFVLIPENEYVDKSGLETALKSAEAVEEEYRYTASSYQVYSEALVKAQETFDNADAAQNTVDSAAVALNNAVKGLKRASVLTAIKLTVKDENGNIFTRPFKFQVYITGTSGQEGWNQFSDAETGVVYLNTSPGWQDDKRWTIAPCYEEPYTFETIDVVIGVTSDGERYYKTINNQPAALDYEATVTVKARPGGVDSEHKDKEIKPDNTILQKYIEEAQQIMEPAYTAGSFEKLKNAIESATVIAGKSGASQEEYNAAAASVKKAEKELVKKANKIALRKQIQQYYGETSYTTAAWEQYKTQLSAAEAVYDNQDATQAQVDEALSRLKESVIILQQGLRASKEELKRALDAAETLREEDYESGYEKLRAAIEEVKKVYNDPEAIQTKADEVLKKLDEAIEALVKKPVKRDYECFPTVFKALVTDSDGTPLSGVYFAVTEEGTSRAEAVRTGDDGIFEYYIPSDQKGKATISLADLGYTTADEHWYTVTEGIWATIKEIDGKNFEEGIRPTYTLSATGKTPGRDPDKIPDSVLDPEEPMPEGRDALKEQIDIAESMKHQASNYTEESFKNLTDVLAGAKKVYEDADALPETINEWAAKLKKARENLQIAEKVLTDRTAIRIMVQYENGTRVKDAVEFSFALGANRPVAMLSRNGVLEYELTTADSGNSAIVISAPEEVTINGTEYLITPKSHEFILDSRSYEVAVAAVDGQYLGDNEMEVSFVLKRKTPLPEVSEWTAECFLYEGTAITGFSETGRLYLEKNQDVRLPDKTDTGEPVTEIAENAFADSGIKSVILPKGLMTIGSKAFAGNQLSSVKIPGSIISIAKDAFAGNSTQVTLEIADKKVLDNLSKAGLDGVLLKDSSKSEENSKPDKKPVTEPEQTVKVKKIKITGMSKKIAAGKKITLKAAVSPSNAAIKSVKWKSSNKKVATVNSKGVVKIKKNTGGKTVTITASAKDGSKVTGKYKITVMKGIVRKIQISGTKSSIKAGKSLKLKAKVTASKGANKKVVWTSSNEKYAKVASSGKVKTYKAGKGKKVKITAKATDGSGKKKTITVKLK